jgi:hypothetical protein
MRSTLLTILLWLCGVSVLPVRAEASETLPKQAREAISRAAEAAPRRDWKALRLQMVDEFTWDFGGHSSAEEAIAERKKDPRPVLEFGRRLHRRCRLVEPTRIECPGRRALDLRAGFVLSDGPRAGRQSGRGYHRWHLPVEPRGFQPAASASVPATVRACFRSGGRPPGRCPSRTREGCRR